MYYCNNRPNDCKRIFELKWFCSVFGLDDLTEVAETLSSKDIRITDVKVVRPDWMIMRA